DWVLPPIRRWSLDYHAYMSDMDGNDYRMTTLFTSRGCPYSCSFCESGRHGVIWDALTRYEPLDIVEHQIKECKELGFTGLAYYDDVFIIHRKRTLKLLELNTKYDMKWRCFLRSDIVCKHGGKEYLQAMKDSGLIEVFIGVESADNEIKKNIHKGTTIEQDTQVLEWCKELGIRCKMSFIFGLPGESFESMQKTKDWIFKYKPHIVQTDRLIPFPGTPLTKNIEEYDLKYEIPIEDEWFFRGRYDINSKSFVSTSHLTRDEIDTFWHKMEKELVEKGLSGYGH
ncbi:MAG: B12-binding domain-containing radical SAM protein, partial [Candidatus Hodarchaeales archaeon]